MKNLFVPYDLAKKLKDKGFDEPCFRYFLDQEIVKGGMSNNLYTPIKNSDASNHISAPLYQQVIDWLREEKEIEVKPEFNKFLGYGNVWQTTIRKMWRDEPVIPMGKMFSGKTYYDSLNKAIEESLNLI